MSLKQEGLVVAQSIKGREGMERGTEGLREGEREDISGISSQA